MENRRWNKLIIVLFFALAIINPLLDILRSTNVKTFEVFGISGIELVNYAIVFFLSILTLATNRNKVKKYYKVIFTLIFLIYFIYVFLHCANIMRFDESVYNQANINVFKETYYICRMYILPLIIVALIYINRELFTKKIVKNILTVVIIEYCIFTILPNLFHVAFVAYKQDNSYITHNFLEWFNYDNNNFIMLTSKGWFYSANSLSAILLVLLMLNYVYFYKNPSIGRALLCFFQILAMIMIGTKTAVYGSLLISIVCYIFHFFESSYKKTSNLKKSSASFFLIMIMLIPFYLYGPLISPKFGPVLDNIKDKINSTNEEENNNVIETPKNESNDNTIIEPPKNEDSEDKKDEDLVTNNNENKNDEKQEESTIDNNSNNKNETTKVENDSLNKPSVENSNSNTQDIDIENIIYTEQNVFDIGKLIGEECNKERVNTFLRLGDNIYWYKLLPYFLDNYTVNENPKFWCNILLEGQVSVRDYRTFKVSINEAIIKSNNNSFDKFLGVGYTANLIDPETDLYYIYFNFGIIGLILFFGPYVLILGYCIINILLMLKSKYNLENFVLGGSLGILILLTHLSGHVLNKTSSAILMACLSGTLLSAINKKNE